MKSKNRNNKVENELEKQIEKDYNSSLTLNDYKQEIIGEIKYLCEFHLKKLNELIENCEKNFQSINFQIANQIIPGEKAISVIEEDLMTSSKIINMK